MPRTIDTGRHPLSSGIPPDWASGWGQDQYGVFATLSVDGIEQGLRWIPPGRFVMGSPEDEPGRKDAEGPQTEVTLAEGFWLFDTPVTQALWTAVMGANPSRFISPDRPVEQVSWDDAQDFVARMNDRFAGLGLAVPSEAQWEYGCRAGTETATYAGPIEILGVNNAPVLDAIAWYGGNSFVGFELVDGDDSSNLIEKQYVHDSAGTRVVQLKAPNGFGLYDMLGNVWEWCAELWHDSHEGADRNGLPRHPDPPDERSRVVRGGSWICGAHFIRAAHRGRVEPGGCYAELGFRCVAGPRGSAVGPGARLAAEPRPAVRRDRAR